MKIKVRKITERAIIPRYAHPGDAGMDLFSCESISLLPGERKLIATGIAMCIPEGYVGLVWDKSGLAANHGLKTMAGVIDAGYRGEIKVLVHNLSGGAYAVEAGSKIAQLLIQPVERGEIAEISGVQELGETSRGDQGFGSSGVK